jgi:hypothetical protein
MQLQMLDPKPRKRPTARLAGADIRAPSKEAESAMITFLKILIRSCLHRLAR